LVTLSLSAADFTSVYTNEFSVAGPQPNLDYSVTTSNRDAGRFLGKFYSGRQNVTLTLTNLPPHSYVTVSFDALIAMTWDGNGRGYINTNDLPSYIPDNGPDIFKVTADGNTMVHTTFASHDLDFYRLQSYPGTYPQDYSYRPGEGAVCVDCCGAKWDLDWYWIETRTKPLPDARLLQDAKYHFDITYTNNSDTTVIVFRSFGMTAGEYQGDLDEWWGLDNIRVKVSDEPIFPVTECKPALFQSIQPINDKTAAIYLVGEAGTDVTIQSSVDMSNWVDERVVSFNGFYKSSVTLKPALSGQSIANIPALKVWRVRQTPRKR